MDAQLQRRIDGVQVKLACVAVVGLRGVTSRTSVVARASGPRSLFIQVTPTWALDVVKRWLGLRLTTGDAAFDKRFEVDSNFADAISVWLGPVTRNRMRSTSGYRFELRRGKALAKRSGSDDDPASRDAAMAAVAALARGRHVIEAAFRSVIPQLDRARLKRGFEKWPQLKGERGGHAISLRICERDQQLTTVVRMQCVAQRDEGQELPETLRERGAAVRTSRGAVIVTLPGICVDPGTLALCIESIAETSRGAPVGPYR